MFESDCGLTDTQPVDVCLLVPILPVQSAESQHPPQQLLPLTDICTRKGKCVVAQSYKNLTILDFKFD